MPTYEYECGSCGHRFEKFSPKISNASSLECPNCGGEAERLISGGAGLLFKGSGFYSTDYRSESYKEAAKQETKDSKEKAPSGEAATPSSAKKPESKKGSN
jgi:putative FmdB family regulatory protein